RVASAAPAAAAQTSATSIAIRIAAAPERLFRVELILLFPPPPQSPRQAIEGSTAATGRQRLVASLRVDVDAEADAAGPALTGQCGDSGAGRCHCAGPLERLDHEHLPLPPAQPEQRRGAEQRRVTRAQ